MFSPFRSQKRRWKVTNDYSLSWQSNELQIPHTHRIPTYLWTWNLSRIYFWCLNLPDPFLLWWIALLNSSIVSALLMLLFETRFLSLIFVPFKFDWNPISWCYRVLSIWLLLLRFSRCKIPELLLNTLGSNLLL